MKELVIVLAAVIALMLHTGLESQGPWAVFVWIMVCILIFRLQLAADARVERLKAALAKQDREQQDRS